MEKRFDTKYGELVIKFSPLNEKNVMITLNDQIPTKVNKNEYVITVDDVSNEYGSAIATKKDVNIRLIGNGFKGRSINIGGFSYVFQEAIEWYEYTIAISLFIFFLIWSNVPALVRVIPVVGGFVGGGIVGGSLGVSFAINRLFNKKGLRCLVILGLFLAGFLICLLLGFAIVSLVSK